MAMEAAPRSLDLAPSAPPWREADTNPSGLFLGGGDVSRAKFSDKVATDDVYGLLQYASVRLGPG